MVFCPYATGANPGSCRSQITVHMVSVGPSMVASLMYVDVHIYMIIVLCLCVDAWVHTMTKAKLKKFFVCCCRPIF
jgi:hypothetical protein